VAWCLALERRDGPTALVLTRQAVPVLDRSRYAGAESARRGGYVLSDVGDPAAILIATGSEVAIALQAQERLGEEGIRARVVSMPCCELFAEQDAAYREQVLPSDLRCRVAIEAGATLGWRAYVGLDGAVVGLDRFGASAPSATLYRELGITAEAAVEAVRRLRATGPESHD
jgi:transketolase